MHRFVHRFIPSLLVLFLVLSLTVSVCASETEYVSPSTFVTWIAGKSEIAQQILSHLSFDVCSISEDGHHHASSYVWDDIGGYYDCICQYCGNFFFAREKDLADAYDDYVSSLPAQGITSVGHLIWQPTFADVSASDGYHFSFFSSPTAFSSLPYDVSVVSFSADISSNSVRASHTPSRSYINHKTGYLYFSVIAPMSGTYGVLPLYPCFSIRAVDETGNIFEQNGDFSQGSFFHYDQGGTVSTPKVYYSLSVTGSWSAVSHWYFPVYEVIPDTALDISSGDTYNITTRPTSITGGNYGIVGDNNQIVKVEDNSTIVNETTNTYYNPATGQTAPITDWSYDYSDRSYNVTLESGDTATITYGDENITIQEGDTVYNIYYLVDGSGAEVPPEPCDHIWTETSRTEPTCVTAGKVISTCSKCQETKTKSISALGHDWQVKQIVTTEYDDTGQLVQEGYMLYECSRCQEQYKSTDGTSPPHGGSEEEGGSTIGGMIEKLLSGVGDVVKGIIKGILSLLTKAVEALQGIADLFTTFVASVVELFGGFTDFLAAVFPFLPQEFFTILSLGLLLTVAAAVLRKFLT